jgi:hypothetical protein
VNVINWLLVVAQLISRGKVTFDEITAIIVQLRGGQTDEDTQAADDAELAKLHVEIAVAKAQAEAEASSTGSGLAPCC